MALILPLRMAGRSLFVQASWSFERLQAAGYFFTVLPALRREPGAGGPAAGPEAARLLETFNTHPYFAGLVAATVVRETGAGEAAAAGIKRSLMCALGGIGDDLFWAHLRPFAALAAMPLALSGSPWAVAVFLLVYNVPHLGVRVGGVAAGLARGRGVLALLRAPLLARAVPVLAFLLPALGGVALGLLAAAPSAAVPLPGLAGALGGALLLFFAAMFLVGRGVSPGLLLGTAGALALAAGIAGEALSR